MRGAAFVEAVPLHDVTFVVLDLETTGGSARSCLITEVGALKFRNGELLGTFETLLDIGLEGIAPAPEVESVLPALLEFVRGAVIVGHNVAFDLRFLAASAERLGYPPLDNLVLDTWALCRRLLGEEVENHKLATVARYLGTEVAPCHRALADAQATAELFHRLLERAATFGVTALDDLLALPATARHRQVAKLPWIAPLPRTPGVLVFRDVLGRVSYVRAAPDLRACLRSCFAGAEPRVVGRVLDEAQSLQHIECAHDLEAEVFTMRLLRAHAPRHNPEVKIWRRERYIRRRVDGRLAVARQRNEDDGCEYLGPLDAGAARAVVDAPDDGALDALRDANHRVDALVHAGRLVVEIDGSATAGVEGGRLMATAPGAEVPSTSAPLAHDLEVICRWLATNRDRVRVLHADPGWSTVVGRPVQPAG